MHEEDAAEAYEEYKLWVSGDLVRARTLQGFEINLDASDACKGDYSPGDMVSTPRGNAIVLGSAEGKVFAAADGEDCWYISNVDIVEKREREARFSIEPVAYERFKELARINHLSERYVSIVNAISSPSPWMCSPKTLLDALRDTCTGGTDEADLCLFPMVKYFNDKVLRILPFVYFERGNELENVILANISTSGELEAKCASTSQKVRRLKHAIFSQTKYELLNHSIDFTATSPTKNQDEYDLPPELITVQIDPMKAERISETVEAEQKIAFSCFGQMFESLHFEANRKLRLKYQHPLDDSQNRVFKVSSKQFGADDYGGPYRSSFF